jgi:polysaccharide pyruvyl transferase WcaK-like protein
MPLSLRRPSNGAPVLLAGAFGQGNVGDEALLDAFCRALADMPLLVASTDPGDTERRHGRPAVASTAWRDVTQAVRDSRALVFAGGTIFKALPVETGRNRWALLRNALAVATFARMIGRPVCMVGVGAGDLSDSASRALTRATARQASLLVLRDDASARALAKVGVPAPIRVGADPAWTLLDRVPTAPQHREDTIVVVPSRWAIATAPGVLGSLAAAIQPALDSGLGVCIQPWEADGTGEDVRWSERLARCLVGAVRVAEVPQDLSEAAQSLASARLVISARFHALLAAAAAGAPLLAVANEHKQAAIASRLGQPWVPADAEPSVMQATVAAALHGQPAARAAVQGEIASAEETFGLLRLVLSGGAVPPETVSGLRLEPTW